MQGRHVMIVGWSPSIPFVSPSSIGNLKNMRTLHDGWLTGSIRWVRMSSADVKAHAEDLERRRAAGQVIGKKRKRRSSNKKCPAKASEGTDDEGSNDEESGVVAELKKTAKRVKHTPKSQVAPKSKAIISESETE
jgi:hypothetical protein